MPHGNEIQQCSLFLTMVIMAVTTYIVVYRSPTTTRSVGPSTLQIIAGPNAGGRKRKSYPFKLVLIHANNKVLSLSRVSFFYIDPEVRHSSYLPLLRIRRQHLLPTLPRPRTRDLLVMVHHKIDDPIPHFLHLHQLWIAHSCRIYCLY